MQRWITEQNRVSKTMATKSLIIMKYNGKEEGEFQDR